MSVWQSGVCVGLAIIAIASDVYARRVPNIALLAALTAGTILLVFLGQQAQPTTGQAALGLIVGLFCFLPFYIFKWMGAGDVKLMAVIGFLLGMPALLPIWAASCLSLTLHAAGNFLLRRFKPAAIQMAHSTGTDRLFNRLGTRIDNARQGRRGMPYAAHIGICTIAYIGTGGFDGLP